LLLFWPYHVGLRSKLWIQRRISTEPHWTLITDGWYDVTKPYTKLICYLQPNTMLAFT